MEKADKLYLEKLRKKAEAFMKDHPGHGELKLSEADKLKLIHELEVYKIELEIQQQELIHSKERVANLTQKYDELESFYYKHT
jgi:hypothetical protein